MVLASPGISITVALLAAAPASADDLDFGRHVEHHLAARSEKLFGFGAPLAGPAGPADDVPRELAGANQRVKLAAGLNAHASIALPPIFNFGSEEQKQRWLVPGIAGEKIGALGITEPGAGSDVAGITTTARRDGDRYIVNGAKTFITNGGSADLVVSLVERYGPEITSVISGTIQRWDAAEASDKIELHVGRDLQFIRLNGTIVGALVGLVIHTVSLVL